jgi:hypothetical protein
MSISKELKIKISKASDKPQEIIVSDKNGMAMEVKVDKCSDLACLFGHLKLIKYGKDEFIIDPCEVENKITYLTEQLKIIERHEDQTILRSSPPIDEGNFISYFEINIQKYSVMLCRYQFDKSYRLRIEVPEPLTKQILNRLIDDMVILTTE